jgi:hypothetical protein
MSGVDIAGYFRKADDIGFGEFLRQRTVIADLQIFNREFSHNILPFRKKCCRLRKDNSASLSVTVDEKVSYPPRPKRMNPFFLSAMFAFFGRIGGSSP